MSFAQPRSAEALERALGDPRSAGAAVGFARSLVLDEAEEFPSAEVEFLNRWGLCDYYIPRAGGGRDVGFDELLFLMRVIARRDLTLAIAHGKTLLGAVCVWLAGSSTQRQAVATLVRQGAPISWGLTERDHGGDLMATETRALPVEGGYVLTGEKWLINNATRSTAITVLANVAETGTRRPTLFFVDKRTLGVGTFTLHPKIKTLGMRGADISGIRFERAQLAADALLGAAGGGLEVTLRALQLTRTSCCALSLGGLDAALEIAVSFARGRRIFGDTVLAIPRTRRVVAGVCADLLFAESTSLVTARSLHVATSQMSVISSVAKFFVPTIAESAVAELAVVLGARHYLREEHELGRFQKVQRDLALVGLFDGSTVVNLDVVATHLLPIAAARASATVVDRASARERTRAVADLSVVLRDVDLDALKIQPAGRNDILLLFDELPGRVAALTDVDPDVAAEVQASLQILWRELQRIEQRAAELRQRGRNKPAELFVLAQEACEIFAAGAAVEVWLANRDAFVDEPRVGSWLALGLSRRAARLRGARETDPRLDDRVVDFVCARLNQDALVSLLPVSLASAGSS